MLLSMQTENLLWTHKAKMHNTVAHVPKENDLHLLSGYKSRVSITTCPLYIKLIFHQLSKNYATVMADNSAHIYQ